MNAVYYEKFYIEDNKIIVLQHTISSSNTPSFHKGSQRNIDYTRSIIERCLTNVYNNAFNNLYSGHSSTRKEISLEKFLQLYNTGTEVHLLTRKAFETKAPETTIKSQYFENDTGEERIEQLIAKLELDVIDIRKYPEVESILRCAILPMFDCQRWIPRTMIVPIIEHYIEKLKEQYSDYALLEHAKTLREFLNKLRVYS
jgi:hypothetical protein